MALLPRSPVNVRSATDDFPIDHQTSEAYYSFDSSSDAEENLAPKIENTSPSEVVVKVGDEVDLFCLAKGVPTPTYKYVRVSSSALHASLFDPRRRK